MSEHPHFLIGSIVEIQPDEGTNFFKPGARGVVRSSNAVLLRVHFITGEFEPQDDAPGDWWFVNARRCILVEAPI
jgi:hypothetical protein